MTEVQSVTEVRELIRKSRVALEGIKNYSQEQVDEMCKVIALAVKDHAEELAVMAVEETGLGNIDHKIGKNLGTPDVIWTTMKGKKSVGVIKKSEEEQMLYIAHPKGVISCVSPTTNPTITPLGNAMMALKGRNTLIVSPHPRALKTTGRTVEIMNNALKKIGAPNNVIQMIEDPSIEATQVLMRETDTILATGGMGMVKAAYSSGKPALGVGQGNVQHIVGDDYKDFETAAKDIIGGRSFDNGLICAGDQSCIVYKKDERAMVDALVANGAFYSDDEEIVSKFRDFLFHEGKINPDVVGQSAVKIARMAGVDVPEDTVVVVLKSNVPGPEDCLSGEKLFPFVTIFTYDTFEEGVEIAKKNLLYHGAGHSAAIHTNDENKAAYAGIQLPVSRLIVNQPGTSAGNAHLLNFLNPTISLGCGSWGGNSLSENVTWEHLINVQRVAFLRKDAPPTSEEIWSE